MTRHTSLSHTLIIGFCVGSINCGSSRQEEPSPGEVIPSTSAGLAGTSWRLVKFQGGDETTLTPDDRSKYTITFEPEGRLGARIDCNRGRGTWESSGPRLEVGPLTLTRAQCPPGSLHDQIVKQ